LRAMLETEDLDGVLEMVSLMVDPPYKKFGPRQRRRDDPPPGLTPPDHPDGVRRATPAYGPVQQPPSAVRQPLPARGRPAGDPARVHAATGLPAHIHLAPAAPASGTPPRWGAPPGSRHLGLQARGPVPGDPLHSPLRLLRPQRSHG
jgi:hypothetical protein